VALYRANCDGWIARLGLHSLACLRILPRTSPATSSKRPGRWAGGRVLPATESRYRMWRPGVFGKDRQGLSPVQVAATNALPIAAVHAAMACYDRGANIDLLDA